MAVRVEVVSVSGQALTLAFYYAIPVGQQLPAADDQGRIPVGSVLSAQEVQDLKDGKIHEIVETFQVPYGMPLTQVAANVQQKWTQGQQPALEQYRALWTFSSQAGRWWDGSAWH